MANVLPREQQVFVLKLLVEGNSLRSITRLTGVHRTTVMALMVRFGETCREFLDRRLRNLELRHVECDEIWTFVLKKQGRLTEAEKANPNVGDQYLFIAQDQDTNLIASHVVGKRNEATTRQFIADLATRIVLPDDVTVHSDHKPQLSTDGWQSYPPAILDTFEGFVRYGVIIKSYQNEEMGRYAPPDVVATDRRSVRMIDDLKTICTSHVERNNLTIRTFMKRFTRLSLGFSKKLENLAAAIAIHVAHFNFCWRPRENKGGRYRMPPAVQAGVTRELWDMERLYDEVMDA